VSTHRPRYRYVAFRLESARAYRREEVLEVMRALTPRLWLVDFEGTSGLIRTTNMEKDAAIAALKGCEESDARLKRFLRDDLVRNGWSPPDLERSTGASSIILAS